MTIESSDRKNLAVSIFVFCLGILFVYLTTRNQPLIHDLNSVIDRNERAANLLGYLLILIGAFSLITFQKLDITIDAAKKRLYVKKSYFLTSPEAQTISFQSIAKVETIRVGRARQPFYTLVFVLKNNILLRTNYWSYDEYEVKNLGQQVAEIIGCTASDLPNKITHEKIFEIALFALGCALATWAIFYHLKFGNFCSAMWFGTAPIFIITITFMTYLRIFKKYLI